MSVVCRSVFAAPSTAFSPMHTAGVVSRKANESNLTSSNRKIANNFNPFLFKIRKMSKKINIVVEMDFND